MYLRARPAIDSFEKDQVVQALEVATMRRRAAPVRWRQYLCRAGSAHSSVEAASMAARNDGRLDRPELVGEGGYGTLPL
jgi:hypothetical protein